MKSMVIIDDESVVIEAIELMVQRAGLDYRIVGTADNGVDGLHVVRRLRPDVVITGIRMPGMDGITLIEQTTQELPLCVFIVISGYREFEYAHKAISLNVSDYIEKPIDYQSVVAALLRADNLLDARKKVHKIKNVDRARQLEKTEAQNAAIAKVLRYIHENYAQEFGLDELSDLVGMTPAYLSGLFKENTGTPEGMPGEWHAVSVVDGDFSVLRAQPGCRVRCREKLPAQRILVTPRGERVVDFGQNLTGWPEFVIRGKAGHSYTLKCFETLDAQGNVYTANLRLAKQELHYTCKGDMEERHHPEFTFYGFRYVHLVDWPANAAAEDFCAWVVHSDMEPTGEFECSEPLVNQLHRNIRWSQRDNFLDVPTDCPQRNERVGWTGDAQIFCRTASCLMDVYAFYRKWLRDVRADQQADGGVSHIVPDIISGKPEAMNDWLLSQGTHSAAGWADAIVICPWTLYLAYGDKQILEENYDGMHKWIDVMRDHAVDNIWNYRLQFGDWVALDAAEGSYFGATPTDLTCTAYYAHSTALFVKIASILGRSDDAAAYGAMYGAIVDKFRKTFFRPDGSMTVQTQTAHILALHFDLVAPEHRKQTAQALVRLLDAEDGHLVTGFMGTTFFTHALANSGYVDRAYDLLLKEDFPSWLYQVKAGATSVWEHWGGIRPDGSMWSPDMNSFNHYAYGSIGEWLYRGVAGIDIDPDDPAYHHAILRPQINERMQYARASIETPYGRLAVGWKLDGDAVSISVRVPANTRATLLLSDFTEALDADGIAFDRNEKGLRAELPSGEYCFRCK